MAKLTHADLAHFTGSLERYQHPLNPAVIYTPGVRFLARQGGAYWLLDAIALYLGSPAFKRAAANDGRLEDMAFWTLTVNDDHSARLIGYADSDVSPFLEQSIPFTDFPLKKVAIWSAFDRRHWTLYLPSEH